MEFNEQTAIEIIRKYKLSESILKVWKTRREIPEKYFSDNFQVEMKISQEDNDRILLKIEHPAINKEIFLTKVGVNKTFADIKRGQTTLTAEDVGKIKKELSLLKAQINNALQSKSELRIKQILNISYLKYRPIFEKLNKTIYDRIMRQRNGNILSHSDFTDFKDNFILFAAQI